MAKFGICGDDWMDILSDGLNNLDQLLLTEMRRRSNPSVSELARLVGIARGTVQSRLARMEERGLVTGYGPDVDPTAAGYGVLAFVTIDIVQGAHDQTIDALRKLPEILEIHTVTGPGDLLCRIVARTNDHLHEVLQRVAAIDEVGRTQSHLALSSPVIRTVADLIAHSAG